MAIQYNDTTKSYDASLNGDDFGTHRTFQEANEALGGLTEAYVALGEAEYQAFCAADTAWQSALERVFGASAGDVRSTVQGRTGETLAPLYAEFRRTMDAWERAVGIYVEPIVIKPAATVHARPAATPQAVETYPIDPIELALAEAEVMAANPAHGKAIASAVVHLLEMEFVHINQGKVVVRGSQTYRADGNTCPCGYNHKACWPRYSALLVETMRRSDFRAVWHFDVRSRERVMSDVYELFPV